MINENQKTFSLIRLFVFLNRKQFLNFIYESIRDCGNNYS